MAQAHGGWASRAHERYARFSLADVVRIPAVIAGVDDGANAPPAPTNEAVERAAGPPERRLQRGDLGDAGGVAPDAAPVAAAPAPAVRHLQAPAAVHDVCSSLLSQSNLVLGPLAKPDYVWPHRQSV